MRKATGQKRKLRLFPKQMEARRLLLDGVTEELIYGGAAGGGKSRLGCAFLIEMCGRYPGTRWFMGREVLKELKGTTLKTFFEVAAGLGLRAGFDFIYRKDEGIFFPMGGSEIILLELAYLPSDPNYDRLGSLEVTGGFVDEIGQITYKAYETLKSRIRFKLNEYGLIPKLLGTLNPTKGWPYSEFYKPFKAGKLEPYRRFLQALPTDNPFIPPPYLTSLRRMKDKAQRERLLNGNWEYDDDPAALFPIEVIDDLFTSKGMAGERYITGDVSRQGRDRMVLGYWEGLELMETVVIPLEMRSDTRLSSAFIVAYAERKTVRLSHVLLDEDGVGGGVVDQVGCKGFVNNASPVLTALMRKEADTKGKAVNYANLKSQCYFLLSEYAADGKVGIRCDDPETRDLITQELEQIKRKDADKDGKVSVLGKDAIKLAINRSPDFADMIMMRMRFLLPFAQAKPKSAAMPFIVGGKRWEAA